MGLESVENVAGQRDILIVIRRCGPHFYQSYSGKQKAHSIRESQLTEDLRNDPWLTIEEVPREAA